MVNLNVWSLVLPFELPSLLFLGCPNPDRDAILVCFPKLHVVFCFAPFEVNALSNLDFLYPYVPLDMVCFSSESEGCLK